MKAGLDFCKVEVCPRKYTAPEEFQWISTYMCMKNECETWEEKWQRNPTEQKGMEKACTSIECLLLVYNYCTK